MDPDLDFAVLMGAFDTVLMGRRSYETVRGSAGGPGMPGMQTYVYSRTLSQEECPGVILSAEGRRKSFHAFSWPPIRHAGR